MKAISAVKKVGYGGRIVIPKDFRMLLNLETGDPLEIFIDDNSIFLRKYERGCIFCNEISENNLNMGGKEVCKKCIKLLKEIYS